MPLPKREPVFLPTLVIDVVAFLLFTALMAAVFVGCLTP